MDRFAVSMFGLDPLDQTRIKLACSLLLAEEVSIVFVDDRENNDLSIFGLDNIDGKKNWEKKKLKIIAFYSYLVTIKVGLPGLLTARR